MGYRKSRNTISTFNLAYDEKNRINETSNAHNTIAKTLGYNQEEDENNDTDPEELDTHDTDDLNKTLGDINTLQMFGKKDPNEKIVSFRMEKLLERMLHRIQYVSLRGSIFALS